MKVLIKRWNEEINAMWLAGHDEIKDWLSDKEIKAFRRSAQRYLKINNFVDESQRAAIVRIIEFTAN